LPKALSLSTSNWFIQYLLPIGWLVLLTGLFWAWDRSLYHKLYYGLMAAPTLIALVLQPVLLKKLLRNPLILSFLMFGTYTSLSLLWSDTDSPATSMIKRPIYVLMLFLGTGLLAIKCPRILPNTLFLAAVIATLSGVISLAYLIYSREGTPGLGRLSGYGALYNPLLSAHVYGFFTAFWLATWFAKRTPFSPVPLLSLLFLGVVIISTGSRTPLLALTATLIWLGIAHFNRRSLIAVCTALCLALSVLLFHPETLTNRGLSYRPDIWLKTVELILEKPWFGYGFDHHLLITLEPSGLAFNDPHNIELAVLLSGGLAGLLLWLTLYAVALIYSWRNRRDALVLTASALVVFGLAAGLTEGRDFLSRPKEHWFLIWIPLALLSAVWLSRTARMEEANAPIENSLSSVCANQAEKAREENLGCHAS